MTYLRALLVAAVVWLGAFEILMQPTTADRLTLGVLLLGFGLLVALVRLFAPRLLARSSGLSRTIPAIATGAVLIVAVGIGLASSLMFISSHDLRLALILLGLGAILGTTVAVALTGPLMDDLDRITGAAGRISGGDLSARSGVIRGDEVGVVAQAFDTMAERLQEATATRAHLESARRRLFTEIGHDLRTPLAALRAAAEALEDGIAEDPGRYLKSMRHDLDTVGDLVDDLFLIARMDSGSLVFQAEAVDLAELADETAEGLSPVAERRGVTIRVDTPGHTVVWGGPTQLARVIRNLVENAIQHAPGDSEVVIEIAPAERSTTVHIIDQGDGFTPYQQAHAFDRHATWDTERGDTERTGLGLTIARGLVEAHRGRIWIEPGPGGRVGFEIPTGRTRLAG